MIWLLLGTVSFVPMAAADNCFLHKRPAFGRLLFLVGCGLLCVSTLGLLKDSDWSRLHWIHIIPIGLALASLFLLVYSVFFAVQPTPEKLDACPADKQPLISSGMYALCRHPGVLWLCTFYGFMTLVWFCWTWLAAFLMFTCGDTLYVLYQDRCIFPHTIDRYADYQNATPFLIPTASSLKEALTSFKYPERSNCRDI